MECQAINYYVGKCKGKAIQTNVPIHGLFYLNIMLCRKHRMLIK